MRNDFMQAKWAEQHGGQLSVDSAPRPFQMAFSEGTGAPLFAQNGFGADIIQFDGGKGVDTHTHEGDHILFVLSGEGIVEYYDEKHDLSPGMGYFIPGHVPHAIRAETALVLIAVGNNHQPVSSEARIDVVAK